MTDSQLRRDARALYALLAEGGLTLAPTATGYRLVAMRSVAVRRLSQLKSRLASKPCVAVGVLGVLDDVTTGLDAATRSWVAAAAARWPLVVVARLNPRSPLLSRTEPHVVAQCTADDSIALLLGAGPLLTTAAALALRDGHLLVGSSAKAAGTSHNYLIDEVPLPMQQGVDQVFKATTPAPATALRLASTTLDLRTGVFLRRGVAHEAIERAWVRRERGVGATMG
jgi:tRNA A37 threonylcarbamoyladenosine synthetase subunit TsaC/SUA5/YrdC